jgi:hypothetical protein
MSKPQLERIPTNKSTLSDKIAFIMTDDFCAKIVNAPLLDLDNVCEGDCIPCRTEHIIRMIRDTISDLKRLAVPCDNNIRYKVDRVTFDDIIKELTE